jgi:hypothetical protein
MNDGFAIELVKRTTARAADFIAGYWAGWGLPLTNLIGVVSTE